MPHQEIVAVLAERIADQTFLRLIMRMLKAGVQTLGGVVHDELGSPQGSIVSPVIANAFLDHVLDQWFARIVTHHCHGYCTIIRYADDALALFSSSAKTTPTASSGSFRCDWESSGCASTLPKHALSPLGNATRGELTIAGSARQHSIISASRITGAGVERGKCA
jgi:Reverse transcriptase (RNA-dependent DNA polymerase)